MSPDFLTELRARKTAILERWRALLHDQPTGDPLASPETLQYLIPESWDRIMATAEKSARTRMGLPMARLQVPACDCGHNPYRAFYIAAEQAIAEAAVHITADQPATERRPGDLVAVVYAVRSLSQADIDAFCGTCMHRGTADNCRFPAQA